MVTVNGLFALLLCESVALQVTVVTPTENVEPEAGVQLEIETASSESLALNAYVTDSAAQACRLGRDIRGDRNQRRGSVGHDHIECFRRLVA